MKKPAIATIFAFLSAPLVPVSLMGIASLPNNGPWSVFFGIALIVRADESHIQRRLTIAQHHRAGKGPTVVEV